jgi:hypothetical protein
MPHDAVRTELATASVNFELKVDNTVPQSRAGSTVNVRLPGRQRFGIGHREPPIVRVPDDALPCG